MYWWYHPQFAESQKRKYQVLSHYQNLKLASAEKNVWSLFLSIKNLNFPENDLKISKRPT